MTTRRRKRTRTARGHRAAARTALAREVASVQPRNRVRAELRAARLPVRLA